MQNLKLIIVKVNPEFNYRNYLHWFKQDVIENILFFKHEKNQRIAFISALLKYYYLATYFNTDPSNLTFGYNAHKKPYLDQKFYKDFEFNISHSGDYVVMIISKCHKVGIDIEYINKKTDINQLQKIVFSISEQLLIRENIHNFFILWTKKEALIKAMGTGFMTSHYKSTKLDLSLYNYYNQIHLYTTNCITNYQLSICLIE